MEKRRAELAKERAYKKAEYDANSFMIERPKRDRQAKKQEYTRRYERERRERGR